MQDIPWGAVAEVLFCGIIIRYGVRPFLGHHIRWLVMTPATPYWVLFLCNLAVCGTLVAVNQLGAAQGAASTAFLLFAVAVAVDILDGRGGKKDQRHQNYDP